jgi:hypothetical protein
MRNPEYQAPIPARYMMQRITLEPIPRFRAPARAAVAAMVVDKAA